MGGIRPSGLHINKPAVIGLVVIFAGCFFVYEYMWAGSTLWPYSKDELTVQEDPVKIQLEESRKSEKDVPETGKKSEPPQPVVWDIKTLEDPIDLSDDIKAGLERSSLTLELTIDGKKYQTYAETVIVKGTAPTQSLLFLHGAKFTSKNWIDIGVLDNVASWGFKAIAVDLPGHGKTVDTIEKSVVSSYLPALIAALHIEKPIIVSPSMSGTYSLPFLFAEPEKSTEKASGFVPIAPGSVKDYESAFAKSQLPTLIVYGTKDVSNGVASLPTFQLLPKSITATMTDAGHACYLDDPKTFIKYLYAFLRQLKA